MKDEIRCAIEFREDTDRTGPGRLVGTILTYGQRAKDRPEVFEPGSLTWPDTGVVLNRQHARGAPIMRVIDPGSARRCDCDRSTKLCRTPRLGVTRRPKCGKG